METVRGTNGFMCISMCISTLGTQYSLPFAAVPEPKGNTHSHISTSGCILRVRMAFYQKSRGCVVTNKFVCYCQTSAVAQHAENDPGTQYRF